MEGISELVLSDRTPALALRQCGAGPTVVLLHGIGGNARNWDAQIEALAPRYNAVAWDMRGYGQSEDYPGPLLQDDLCDDLSAVLDYFETDEAHLIGLSMGGMIAQEYYRRHPNRVRSLILANTNAGIGVAFTREQKDEFVRLRKTPLIEGRTPSELVPAMLTTLLGENPPEAAVENISASIAQLRPASYIKAIEAIVTFDSAQALTDIAVPVLLIGSTLDKVIPLSSMETMDQRIANSQLHVMEGAGHLSNLERPQEFNSLVLRFLAEN